MGKVSSPQKAEIFKKIKENDTPKSAIIALISD
jgi:hypothetical protein